MSPRYVTLNNVRYMVVPSVLLSEGVWCGKGGPVYYGADVIAASYQGYHGVPLLWNHAAGGRSFQVWEKQGLGIVLFPRVDSGVLSASCYFDVNRTCKIAGFDLYRRLVMGHAIPVSCGFRSKQVANSYRATFHGIRYESKAENILPNHVAVLSGDDKPACISARIGVNTNTIQRVDNDY